MTCENWMAAAVVGWFAALMGWGFATFYAAKVRQLASGIICGEDAERFLTEMKGTVMTPEREQYLRQCVDASISAEGGAVQKGLSKEKAK